MPWRCPACGDEIRHTPLESMPRPGTLYRCPVCRLELVFDPLEGKLILAPLDDANDRPAGPARRRRSK
jgi:rubredoxin